MLDQAELDRLKQFHAAHFSNQPTPKLASIPERRRGMAASPTPGNDCDELGFYEDGTKRTLTDAQIKMFRHSEIQRLLSERRATQAREKKRQKRKSAANGHKVAASGWKPHSDPRLQTQERNIDALKYDDESTSEAKEKAAPRSFLWPKLGSP
ncbi:hypothetical protein PV08_00776 [Exophiala spinifera]|uniref:Uncharacterized protein n=1 Tax=Exophiala spinifera TaxID=91928 RepID=A0A0D1YY41_9EURO|nr:uncharacterized protein PV08_00776 [Exophiala spinifera]KIW20201.1 hypothetical protein PV08_00776 [Exophiala spinifera]